MSLEIIRRSAERGLRLAQESESNLIDIFQHILDELQRTEKEIEDEGNWLCALESAGVDNWEGYDYAREIYNDMKEENGN